MVVSVRLFAMLRERAGSDSLEIELDEGATVGEAISALADETDLGPELAEMPVLMAVNREYAPTGATLKAGDELALIPPVSGGSESGVVRVRVGTEPLDLGEIVDSVRSPAAGAVVSFQGVTRSVDRLEYEAYVEMAEERIREILEACVERHGLESAAAEHRIGTVPLSEPSVIVAVSAAHREEAFVGAREAIDRIKAEAPIWKKEIEGGAGEWARGTVPRTAEEAGAGG
jgi:molybdopterin synthase catalytic subunit